MVNYLVLLGVFWEKFEEIEVIFEGIEGVCFIYLDGELEIVMSLSKVYEKVKSIIGFLLEVYMRVKKIRFYMMGSLILGMKEVMGWKELDEFYNIYIVKDIFDLVIEVIVISGSINILEIYCCIGVFEVWFY